MTVVDNARYEPEQILFVTSSSPVAERAFAGKIVGAACCRCAIPRQPKEDQRAVRLERRERDRRRHPREVRAGQRRATCRRTKAATRRTASSSWRRSAGTCHVLVKDGVQGTGGYLSGKPFVATVKVEPYHARADVPRAGRAAVAVRRPEGRIPRRATSSKVEVEIGRVLPNQLQHLAPQMWDFSRPELYGDLEDKLVERFATTRDYSGKAPGKPTYDSIDVGQYLQDKARSRGAASSCCTSARRELAAARRRRRRRRGRRCRRRPGSHRGHAADPGHRSRLHREAAQGRQPRRVRAVDPQRAAGRRARASRWSAATASRCSPPRPTPPAAPRCRAAATELRRAKRRRS